MLELTRLFSLLVITLPLLASGINSATLTFFNQCNYTVWPALDSDKNVKFSTTGFVLETGETFRLDAPSAWTGRVWGRTECSPNPDTGSFACSTGDCDTGKVECGSRGGSPPVTLVEIGARKDNGLDYYYVSLAEGFNIPMKVAPTSGNCSSSECSEDVNAVCPTNLQITKKNKVVACNSACPASNRSNCEPYKYPGKFNNACPKAYTKSRNNKNNSTLSCSGPTDFDIIFCPLAAPTFGNASRRVGDSITAGYKSYRWLSPSGDFAFGFYQLPNELYLLAIWFDKIPDKTIIWYANGDNLAPKGSMLTLNDSHGLILSNPQGLEVWKSNFNSSTILYGLMNDDGNFQLLDQNFVPLWESFTHPTDTLVPNQVIKLNGEISSRYGEFNFSRGRFKLHLQKDGNLVLNRYSYERYYASGTVDSINKTNVGMKLIFKKSGELYILKKSGDMFTLNKPNETNGFYKATINFDGVFTVTFYQKDKKKWTRMDH